MTGNHTYGPQPQISPWAGENNMIRLMGLIDFGKSFQNETLVGNQAALDVDGDGKIEKSDLAKLRKSKNESHHDHEVSMAHNLLNDIIKNTMELKFKLGPDEKDIPAWIQDHISQAQNFISQANTNYHEYDTPETSAVEL
jgi:hypothetical protein